MYRLTVHKTKDGKFQIAHRRSGRRWIKYSGPKHLKIGDLKADKLACEAAAWFMARALLEAQRDLLYSQFGKNWRFAERHHKKALINSMLSSAKRAKAAPVETTEQIG